MPKKICLCCGQQFAPCPQVPSQAYCSSPDCQRERKARWEREKRTTDPDYRENQIRAQRAWLARRPDYWKNYRARDRNQTKKVDQVLAPIAKMDESKAPLQLASGLYQITLIEDAPQIGGGGWLVEIRPYATPPTAKKTSAKR